MPTVEQIKLLTVRGKADGLDAVRNALDRISAAQVKVTQTGTAMGDATETQSNKVKNIAKQWDSYTARTDAASKSMQQFSRDVGTISRAFETGIFGSGTEGAIRFASEITKAKQRLNEFKAASGSIDQSSFNNLLGIGSANKSAQESAQAIAEELDKLDEVARQKAQQIGSNFQSTLNEYFGIGGMSKSARDSAAAFSAVLDPLDEIASQKAQQIGQIFAEDLNSSLIAGTAKSARDSASVFSEAFDEFDRIATLKAEQTGKNFTDDLNARLVAGSGKSARDSASAFSEQFKIDDDVAAKIQKLRETIDPLGEEFARLGKDMAVYNQMAKEGKISTEQLSQYQEAAGKRLSDFERNLKNGATAGRVMSGELVNLSYQLNDVVTGLMLGQSPFMIFAQQGGQIFQIFQSSKASILEFAQTAGSKLLSFFTITRVGFGGVVAGIGLAVAALNSYLTAQQKVQQSLLGAGRASGSTQNGVNSIASQGSSTFGLSVSEARDLASAMAATGKVANDNILPIVKMGHDIALAFGTDAAGAADILAKAFSDPVSGADQLNQKLGFLDAATKRNITNLAAQNKLYDAQKALIDASKSSLEGYAEAQGLLATGWTAIGNMASNAWGAVGKFFAEMVGAGDTLENKIARTKKELEDLQASGGQVPDLNTGLMSDAGGDAAIIAKRQELEKLEAAYQKVQYASMVAQAAQKSFAQEQTVRDLTPEIAAREKLNNDLQVLHGILQQIGNDEAAGAILKQLGVTMEQLSRSTDVAQTKAKTFKSEFDASISALNTQNQAITAFSPSAKGNIAYQQSIDADRNSNFTEGERRQRAEMAYSNAVKQATTAISEQNRERLLAANQSVDSAKLEIDLIGRSIGQQTELRANLQARQQLEQQAAQNRTAFDDAEYERLKKINAELGKQAQLRAQAQLASDIKFDRSQIGLSDAEQSANAKIRSIYGDDMTSSQAQFYKQQLMINDALKQYNDVSKSALTGFIQDISSGKSALEALGTALNKIGNKLIEMAVDGLWGKAFSGTSGGGLGWIGQLLGFGGGSSSSGGVAGTIQVGSQSFPSFSAKGNIFANDNMMKFAKGSAFTNQIISNPTLFRYAQGGGFGLGEMGEAGPEAVVPLRRMSNGNLGVHMSGNGGGTVVHANFNPTYNVEGSGPEIAQLRQQMAQDKAEFNSHVENAVRKAEQGRRLR